MFVRMPKQKSAPKSRKILFFVAIVIILVGIGVFLRLYFLTHPLELTTSSQNLQLETNNPVALSDLEIPQLSAPLPVLGAGVTNPNALPATSGVWLKVSASNQTKLITLAGISMVDGLTTPSVRSLKYLQDGTLLFATTSTSLVHAQLWQLSTGTTAKVLYTAGSGDEINTIFFEPIKKNLFLLLQNPAKQLFRVIRISPSGDVEVVFADKQDVALDMLYVNENILYMRNGNCLAISLETKQTSTQDCNYVPQSTDEYNFIIDSGASIKRYQTVQQQMQVILAAANLQSYSLLYRAGSILGFLITELPAPGSQIIPLNKIQLIDMDGNPITSYTNMPSGQVIDVAIDQNQNAYIVVLSAAQTQDLYVHLKEGEDKWQKLLVTGCDLSCKYEFLQ